MSEEMFNDGINVDDIYALLCMNRTNNLCNNTTIQTHEAQYDEELIAKWGYYLEGLAMTPISVFGMVGNALSVVVLSSKEMRSSFNQLLAALASFDLIYLFVSVMVFGLPKLCSPYAKYILPRAMPIAYGVVHIGRVGSVFLTLSVTVERFFAIVYPLKRIRRTRFLIYSSVIGAIAYNIPRFLEFETNYIKTDEGNETFEAVYEPTELRTNSIYVQLYVVWMRFSIIEIIPYVTICLLNAAIIIKIWKSKETQKQLKEAQKESYEERKRELNMAVVLLCVVILFITCQTIKIIPDIYEALYCSTEEIDGQYYCAASTTIEILVSVSNLCMAINSASNFIIYMLRGDKFRRVFKQTIQKYCCLSKKPSLEVSRFTTDTRRTETIKLTTLHGTNDKQSQRLSAYVPNGNNNGSSFTSRASNQTTSFVITKIEKQHIESNMISVKKGMPVLRCNCSSPKQKSQSAIIPKIELNKENSEVESKNSSPRTADESYHELKEGIDKKETHKSQNMHVTDAANNILHIDMDDSVHKRDRTIQTTPVIWL